MFRYFLSTIVILAGVNMASAMIVDDREEFLKPTYLSEHNCSVESVTIRDQDIDDEFLHQFYGFLSHWRNVKNLTIDQCRFYKMIGIDAVDFSYLGSLSLTKLAMTNCGLTDEDMGEVLRNLGGYTEEEIDFSNNKLGADRELFDKLMSGYFNGGKFAIKAPNLSGNPALTNNLETITDLDESTNNSARSSQNKESF